MEAVTVSAVPIVLLVSSWAVPLTPRGYSTLRTDCSLVTHTLGSVVEELVVRYR